MKLIVVELEETCDLLKLVKGTLVSITSEEVDESGKVLFSIDAPDPTVLPHDHPFAGNTGSPGS